MKRVLIATTAAVIAFSGAASAMTTASDNLERQVQVFVPTADLSDISLGGIAHLNSVLSEDGSDSFAQTKVKIEGVLNAYN